MSQTGMSGPPGVWAGRRDTGADILACHSPGRKLNEGRGSSGSVWQDESFDRLIRNEKEFRETLDYMFRNPATRGVTEESENYAGWFLNRGA